MCGYDTTYFECGSNSARALRLYRNRFPQQTVQHNLKKHIFFPCIPRKVHALFENDPQRRIEFCIYFISKFLTQ
jgi:hypothetical protein